jgi:hypothetical protein
MSEKQQHTLAHMRVLMEHRYGDGLHHKHNKLHSQYRLHQKSHPAHLFKVEDETEENKHSTGIIHQLKQQKIRKRLAKGRYH